AWDSEGPGKVRPYGLLSAPDKRGVGQNRAFSASCVGGAITSSRARHGRSNRRRRDALETKPLGSPERTTGSESARAVVKRPRGSCENLPSDTQDMPRRPRVTVSTIPTGSGQLSSLVTLSRRSLCHGFVTQPLLGGPGTTRRFLWTRR